VFTKDERKDLLRLARRSIAARLEGVSNPAEGAGPGPGDRVLAGAFVSLHLHDDLRGCIGYPWGDRVLREVVAQCAAQAATEDPRFPPLGADELADVEIEVSVLGGIEVIKDVSEIEVGRHGLIAEQGFRRGLLLPQVASEHRWDRETFLAHTCMKAGLDPDAWRRGARLFRFEAEVFGEKPRD
jgi:AmmeMemoRadiSam system protein A